MALATQCPHCNTIFRVAADQLKLRGGIVRCGSCQEVFDGNACLVDPLALAAPAAAPQEPVPEPVAPPEPVDELGAPSPSDAFDAQMRALEARAEHAAPPAEPAFDLDFDTSFDPFGILPKEPHAEAAIPFASLLEPEPERKFERKPLLRAPPEPAIELDFDLEAETDPAPAPATVPVPAAPAPVIEKEPQPAMAVAEIGHDHHDGEEEDEEEDFHVTIESAAPADMPAMARVEPQLDLPDAPAPPAVQADVEEPGFVKRSRQQQRAGKIRRVLMGIGSIILLLALLGQGLTTFRNAIAANFPGIKPTLVAACAVAGCRIDLPAQIDLLTIEAGELQKMGGTVASLLTQLRNHGATVQAWPNLELILNDGNDKPLARRVFTPREYLPADSDPGKGIGAHSEQAIKLYLELAQLTASGYHIAVFYP